MTPNEAIDIVNSKAKYRSRHVGQEPFWDEVLVAEIERLKVVERLTDDARLIKAVLGWLDTWGVELKDSELIYDLLWRIKGNSSVSVVPQDIEHPTDKERLRVREAEIDYLTEQLTEARAALSEKPFSEYKLALEPQND